MTPRLPTGVALAAVLVAAVVLATLAAYRHGVAAGGGLFIPDDGASLYEAKVHAAGRLFGEQPPVEPRSFRIGLVLDGQDGRRYGKDYPGFPILLAIGEAAGAPWMVNPVLAALLLVGTFLLGRSLHGSACGLGAALLLGSSPVLFQLAGTYLNHVAFLTMFVASVWMLLRSRECERARWAAGAGFAFGWAVAIRPFDAVLLGSAVALLLAHDLVRGGAKARRRALAFVASSLPWALLLFGWNHAMSGSPWVTPYELWNPANRPGLPGNARADHDLSRVAEKGILVLESYVRRLFVVPWSGVAVVVLALAASRRLGKAGVLLVIASVVPVIGYALYPGIGGPSAMFADGRYYSATLPVLALLASLSVAHLARDLPRVLRGGLLVTVVGLFVAAAVGPFAAEIQRTESTRVRPLVYGNREFGRFLASQDDERRVVFVDASTYQVSDALLETGPGFDGPTVVAIYWEPPTNARIMEAMPEREPFLFRVTDGEPSLEPYDPLADSEGPPMTEPYRRWMRKRNARPPR